MNIYYNAVPVNGVDVSRIDTSEITRLKWFEADGLPGSIAFPHHSKAVLDAWLNRHASSQTA